VEQQATSQQEPWILANESVWQLLGTGIAAAAAAGDDAIQSGLLRRLLTAAQSLSKRCDAIGTFVDRELSVSLAGQVDTC